MEFEPSIETKISGSKPTLTKGLTLQKAVDMGEYRVDYLSIFPEWLQLSRIMQWNLIRQAFKNRRRFLRVQYAEIINQLDYSKKPYLAEAAQNVHNQIREMTNDEEKYQVEYSK